MRAFNSTRVLDETTEEGRLFQAISKVSGVLKFVRCPGTSNVWSRGQILIFVKGNYTGVNLLEGG